MPANIADITKRLDRVTTQLEAGHKVSKAAGASVEDNATSIEVVSKGHSTSQQQGRSKNGSVSDVFEGLARVSKQFRHLGNDRVLEDPRTYLRQKDASGRYLISNKEIGQMVQAQLQNANSPLRKDCPTVDEWKRTSSNPAATDSALMNTLASKDLGNGIGATAKALDVTSGAALIRTDIEQLLHEIYLRKFPLDEFLTKEPANGIVHTYDTRTAIGTAAVITDLGDMSGNFSNSTYNRAANSHIATIVSPRGIGLKLIYATQQSGMNFDLSSRTNLELVAATQAIASLVQAYALQYTYTDAAGTVNNESGTYDANGFDGLRYLLTGASSSITKGTTQAYTDVIDQAVGQMINAGAEEENLTILSSVGARRAVNAELLNYYRIVDQRPAGGFDNNQSQNGIATVSDWMTKFMNIPANTQATGIGYYTLAGVVTEDMYIVDPAQLAMAYLGSPTITVLELPVGFNNVLSQVYYPFMMTGLVCYAPTFLRKVRVPYQAV
jgi:hypothetical protein